MSTATMTTVMNNDTGSLRVGNVDIHIGSKIQVEGEKEPRLVSYIMGTGEKTHACTKGCGPFPMGEVKFTIL